MKRTCYLQYHASQGSALLVVMGTVVVIGIALAAVLSLTTHEQRILARTAAWNAALPVAEAGIEEALSHLMQVDGGPRGVNGWVASGSSFVLSRTNSSDSRYVVGIAAATPPSILSVGEVWCPSAGRYIKRTVLVTTLGRGKFAKGLMAKDKITFVGNFSSDSFDSLNPELSTDGQYDPAKRSDNGDVGTNLSEPGAIDISGTVQIYGRVATGPEGTININSQSSIGSEAWVDGGNLGLQDYHHSQDVNVSYPIATAPYTTGTTPQSGKIDGVTYKYILEGGVNYQLSTLVLTKDDSVLVRGKARLLVDKDVSMAGQSVIKIEPDASLELYVTAGTISMTGKSVINESGNAADFSLTGLPGVENVNMSGNGTFLGTIYAPQASLKMSGGGNDPLDFIGGGIFNDISGVGNFRFHYDMALGYDAAKELVVTSWKEI